MSHFNFRIETVEDKYRLILDYEDKESETIADIYAQEDVMLIAYIVEQYRLGKFNSDEFSSFLMNNISKFPFLSMPKE